MSPLHPFTSTLRELVGTGGGEALATLPNGTCQACLPDLRAPGAPSDHLDGNIGLGAGHFRETKLHGNPKCLGDLRVCTSPCDVISARGTRLEIAGPFP
jgi:hypothetical protein